MGRIGSKEIYLISDKFGITEIFSGLIDITGSTIMGGKKHTASSTVVSGKAQSISTMAQVHNDANSRTSTVKTTVRDQR